MLSGKNVTKRTMGTGDLGGGVKFDYVWVKQSVPKKWLVSKQIPAGLYAVNNDLDERWRTAGCSWLVHWKLYNSSCLLRPKRWVQRRPRQRFWTRKQKSRADLLKEDYITFFRYPSTQLQVCHMPASLLFWQHQSC